MITKYGIGIFKDVCEKKIQGTLNLQKRNSTKMNVLLEWEEIEQLKHLRYIESLSVTITRYLEPLYKIVKNVFWLVLWSRITELWSCLCHMSFLETDGLILIWPWQLLLPSEVLALLCSRPFLWTLPLDTTFLLKICPWGPRWSVSHNCWPWPIWYVKLISNFASSTFFRKGILVV